MADLVSEIISQQAIDQLEFANSQLELAVKNVNNVANAAKGITIDFKGAANIGELNATLAKQEDAIKKLEDATKKYEGAVNARQRAVDIAERNELLGIQRVISEREKAAAKEDALILKQLANEDKLYAKKLKQAQKEEEILNRLIQKEENAAAKKELLRQRQTKMLEVAEAKEMKLVADTARQKELANEREEKALAKLNNAYEQLKVQYKQAADEAKRLGAEFGVMDSRAVSASNGAMKLYKSLLAVELSVGQAQRQVGQYNQAAFAMTQVLREMPAFANSVATGFMAISNNVPILVDEINKLRTANAALKASGADTIPVWKTLMSAIVSPVGLITIATTALTFLAAKTDIFKSSVDEAAKSAENLANSIAEIGKAAESSYEKQTLNAQALIDVVSDITKGEKVRLAAFKELQKLYPQYLKDLTQEQMLKGDAYTAMKNIEEEIRYKVQLEALESKITALLKERQDIQIELNKPIDDAEKLTALNDRFAAINDELKIAKKEFKDYKAAVLSFPQAPEKEKKEKKVKDTTLKSESDLLRAEYELAKQRTEQNIQEQKYISDNVELELNKRLDAYMEYQSELFQLSVLERNFIVAQEDLKIEDLKRKRATAKGQEITNINEQIKAAEIRKKTAEEKTAGDLVAIDKKGAAERLAIISGSNDTFIEAQKDLLLKLSTNEVFFYLDEIENLKDALEKKEITRREYNKRLAELQKKQHIAFLQAEIEFDKKVLANQSLTPEKKKQYEEKLKNDLLALSNAEKGVSVPKKGNFRITDSIAKLFVPSEGMENEEQYLQEFYDRTVDLANKSADAIIEAKNRQFEAEMNRLDAQAEAVRNNYEQQSLFIQNTVRDENDRFNQQQKLLAQTQAQEATIEQQKREVAKRQAAAQKTAAAAAIIQNTAIAVTSALKYPPPASGILIGLITAAASVQLAAALNTPIPAYKEGTDNHQGGKFYAGDGGEKELIVSPNKAPYWSKNVTTMYDEPAGTKVIPKSVIDYAMSNTTANTSSLSAAYEAHSNAMFAKVVGDIVGRQFDATGRKLAYVIEANKPTQPKGESVREELSKMRNLQGL